MANDDGLPEWAHILKRIVKEADEKEEIKV